MENPHSQVMGRYVNQMQVYKLIRENENRKNSGENTIVV